MKNILSAALQGLKQGLAAFVSYLGSAPHRRAVAAGLGLLVGHEMNITAVIVTIGAHLGIFLDTAMVNYALTVLLIPALAAWSHHAPEVKQEEVAGG